MQVRLRYFLEILRLEKSLIQRWPFLLSAILAIMVIPSLYAMIYLSSVWDPYKNTRNLPVALVSLDQGTVTHGTKVELGDQVTRTLEERQLFYYRKHPSELEAKAAVQRGDSYFALMIPKDFSKKAMQGQYTDPAKLVVYVSEGTSFFAATLGKRFASEVAHLVNETLNAKRWEILLGKLDDSKGGLKKLKEGVTRLRDGTIQLNDGSQLLATKNQELAQGLEKLLDGAQKIRAGEARLKQETLGIPFVGTKISGAAGQLEEGLKKLENGLSQALDGSRKLAEGASRLQGGSERLKEGMNLLYQNLPAKVDTLEGDAQGLAASVVSVPQTVSEVENNASAFAPYFIALSLWIGAVLTTFVFQFRHIAEPVREASQSLKMLNKAILPGCVVVGQATLITLSMKSGLSLKIPSLFEFWVISVSASLNFLFIIMGLIAILGDAGRLVALLFLVFQLASAGGAFPIELSSDIFRTAHALLPMTHIVKSYRSSLFGAYAGFGTSAGFGAFTGGWLFFIGKLWLTGLFFLAVTWLIGRRWKYVPEMQYRPALDV
jgi:putative membrane protein